MTSFNYETDFKLKNSKQISEWISNTIKDEDCNEDQINYIFCSDEYLHKINLQYLKHNTLTDIISFDYSERKNLHGDIYISVDRVNENANSFGVSFENELARVIIHGILHFCGYKDKSKKDATIMREKENYYLSKLFS